MKRAFAEAFCWLDSWRRADSSVGGKMRRLVDLGSGRFDGGGGEHGRRGERLVVIVFQEIDGLLVCNLCCLGEGSEDPGTVHFGRTVKGWTCGCGSDVQARVQGYTSRV